MYYKVLIFLSIIFYSYSKTIYINNTYTSTSSEYNGSLTNPYVNLTQAFGNNNNTNCTDLNLMIANTTIPYSIHTLTFSCQNKLIIKGYYGAEEEEEEQEEEESNVEVLPTCISSPVIKLIGQTNIQVNTLIFNSFELIQTSIIYVNNITSFALSNICINNPPTIQLFIIKFGKVNMNYLDFNLNNVVMNNISKLHAHSFYIAYTSSSSLNPTFEVNLTLSNININSESIEDSENSCPIFFMDNYNHTSTYNFNMQNINMNIPTCGDIFEVHTDFENNIYSTLLLNNSNLQNSDSEEGSLIIYSGEPYVYYTNIAIMNTIATTGILGLPGNATFDNILLQNSSLKFGIILEEGDILINQATMYNSTGSMIYAGMSWSTTFMINILNILSSYITQDLIDITTVEPLPDYIFRITLNNITDINNTWYGASLFSMDSLLTATVTFSNLIQENSNVIATNYIYFENTNFSILLEYITLSNVYYNQGIFFNQINEAPALFIYNMIVNSSSFNDNSLIFSIFNQGINVPFIIYNSECLNNSFESSFFLDIAYTFAVITESSFLNSTLINDSEFIIVDSSNIILLSTQSTSSYILSPFSSFPQIQPILQDLLNLITILTNEGCLQVPICSNIQNNLVIIFNNVFDNVILNDSFILEYGGSNIIFYQNQLSNLQINGISDPLFFNEVYYVLIMNNINYNINGPSKLYAILELQTLNFTNNTFNNISFMAIIDMYAQERLNVLCIIVSNTFNNIMRTLENFVSLKIASASSLQFVGNAFNNISLECQGSQSISLIHCQLQKSLELSSTLSIFNFNENLLQNITYYLSTVYVSLYPSSGLLSFNLIGFDLNIADTMLINPTNLNGFLANYDGIIWADNITIINSNFTRLGTLSIATTNLTILNTNFTSLSQALTITSQTKFNPSSRQININVYIMNCTIYESNFLTYDNFCVNILTNLNITNINIQNFPVISNQSSDSSSSSISSTTIVTPSISSIISISSIKFNYIVIQNLYFINTNYFVLPTSSSSSSVYDGGNIYSDNPSNGNTGNTIDNEFNILMLDKTCFINANDTFEDEEAINQVIIDNWVVEFNLIESTSSNGTISNEDNELEVNEAISLNFSSDDNKNNSACNNINMISILNMNIVQSDISDDNMIIQLSNIQLNTNNTQSFCSIITFMNLENSGNNDIIIENFTAINTTNIQFLNIMPSINATNIVVNIQNCIIMNLYLDYMFNTILSYSNIINIQQAQVQLNILINQSNFQNIFYSQALGISSYSSLLSLLLASSSSLSALPVPLSSSSSSSSSIMSTLVYIEYIPNSIIQLMNCNFTNISSYQGPVLWYNNTNIYQQQQNLQQEQQQMIINIQQCNFYDNLATYKGGVMSLYDQNQNLNISFWDCEFVDNNAYQGASILYFNQQYIYNTLINTDYSNYINWSQSSCINCSSNYFGGPPAKIMLTVLDGQNGTKNITNGTMPYTGISSYFFKNSIFKISLTDEINQTFLDPNINSLISIIQQNTRISLIPCYQGLCTIYGNTSSLILFGQAFQIINITFKYYYNSVLEFNLTFNAELRPCISGEINQTFTGYCINCTTNYYSFDPNDDICLSCPENAYCPGGNQVIVQSGYWRSNISSSIIYNCPYSFRCNGGLDSECMEGYTSILCLGCDYNKGYVKENLDGKCIKCGNLLENLFVFIIMFIINVIYNMYYIYCSTNIVTTISDPIKYNDPEVQVTIIKNSYIKFVTTYGQIINLIFSFTLYQYGKVSTLIIYIFGLSNPNTTSSLTSSLECIYELFDIPTDKYYYATIIYSILQPLLLILIIIIIQLIKWRIFNTKLSFRRKNKICLIMLCIYINQQTNLINTLLSYLSCIQIDNDSYYLIAHPDIICSSDNILYINLLCWLVLPVLIIWIFIIPAVLITYEYKYHVHNKSILTLAIQSISIEYKKNYSYWGFLLMISKSILLLLCNIITNQTSLDISNKTMLMILIFIIYLYCLFICNPYSLPQMNQIDKYINFIFILTLAFSYIISQNHQDYIFYLSGSAIIILNLYMMYYLFLSLLIIFFNSWKKVILKCINYLKSKFLSNNESKIEENLNPFAPKEQLQPKFTYFSDFQHEEVKSMNDKAIFILKQ